MAITWASKAITLQSVFHGLSVRCPSGNEGRCLADFRRLWRSNCNEPFLGKLVPTVGKSWSYYPAFENDFIEKRHDEEGHGLHLHSTSLQKTISWLESQRSNVIAGQDCFKLHWYIWISVDDRRNRWRSWYDLDREGFEAARRTTRPRAYQLSAYQWDANLQKHYSGKCLQLQCHTTFCWWLS